MKKRILALLAALALLLGLCACGGPAEPDESDDSSREQSDKSYREPDQTPIDPNQGRDVTPQPPAPDFDIENGVLEEYLGPGGDVVIPDSVTSIGEGAFDFCKSLTDVYYGGSQEQWALITIEYSNDPLINATIHYNSAG